jgi:cytochrome P450
LICAFRLVTAEEPPAVRTGANAPEHGPLRRGGEQFTLAAQRPDVAGNVEGGVPGRRLHVGKDATTAPGAVSGRGGQCDDGARERTSGHGIRQRCPGRKVSGVTAHYPPLAPEHIDLSDIEFWGWPMADRQAAFAMLRSLDHPPFYAEPEFIFEAGPGYYALVRHADVVEASRNPDVFSSAKGATSIPDLPVEFNEYFGSMINMDDPRHARLRRIVSRAFTPRMIQRFADDVARIAAEIVDDLLDTGPCDFVEHVATRLPLTIICQLMGIPDDRYRMVLRNTNIILSGFDPELIGEDMNEVVGQILAAGAELGDLVTGLGQERADKPGDDLVSALVTANIDGEQLTTAELASFFILLVVAGNETTRNALSHALLLLTDFPDQRELLLAGVDGHLEGAVEEIVRYASPVMFMRRTVTRDFQMNGHGYHEGDKAVLFYWSANRDESVFTDPGRFDITRSPNPHVGFGAPGPHFCLGAHLARREITAMLRELLTRVPGIRATAPPDRLLSSFINGIKHVPCDFGG